MTSSESESEPSRDESRRAKRKSKPKSKTKDKKKVPDRPRRDVLYCLCQKPYKRGDPMTRCDLCEEWYHGWCIGLDPKSSEGIAFMAMTSDDEFECFACKGKPQPEPYELKKGDLGETEDVNNTQKASASSNSSSSSSSPSASGKKKKESFKMVTVFARSGLRGFVVNEAPVVTVKVMESTTFDEFKTTVFKKFTDNSDLCGRRSHGHLAIIAGSTKIDAKTMASMKPMPASPSLFNYETSEKDKFFFCIKDKSCKRTHCADALTTLLTKIQKKKKKAKWGSFGLPRQESSSSDSSEERARERKKERERERNERESRRHKSRKRKRKEVSSDESLDESSGESSSESRDKRPKNADTRKRRKRNR